MSVVAAGLSMRNPGVRWIALGWAGFITENLVLSENRTAIIDALGDKEYHLVYSGLSTLACSSIAYGALRYRNQAPFRVPSPAGRAAGFALQAVGLVGASQFLPKLQVPLAFGAGVTVPAAAGPSGAPSDALPQIPAASQSGLTVRCPIDFSPSDVPADGVYGVKRVTRHAMFWSFGLLGLGTAFATPYATWVVLGAMPAAFAALGGLHQDSRYRRGMGGTLDPEMDARTSSFPFVALATGQQKWADLWPEIKGTNTGLAVLLAAGLALRRGRSLAVVRSALARKA